MLKQFANHYYIEQGLNCAESILLAANDEYELGITQESAKLIAGFGGGIGCGNTCGALAGAISAIGQLLITETAHKTEGFGPACAKLMQEFEAKLGSTMCSTISITNKKDDESRCLPTIEAACEVLESFVSELRDAPVTAEQKAEVKGLGFLFDKNTANRFNARVITVNGKITAEQMHAIAEASEKFGLAEASFTARLTVELQGVPYYNIKPLIAFLAEHGMETGGTGPKVRPIVSCKGTTCQYGNIDTYALSREIHERFYKGYRQVKLPHKFKIAVGGCPNSCVKPSLNDVGIVGQRIPKIDLDKCRGCKKCAIVENCPIHSAKVIDGKLCFGENCNHCGHCIGKCPFDAVSHDTYGYKIYIGGRWGKEIAIGKPLNQIFTDKETALQIVEKCILLFRDLGKAGERLSDTVERIGFAECEKLLLRDELLARREEIIAD